MQGRTRVCWFKRAGPLAELSAIGGEKRDILNLTEHKDDNVDGWSSGKLFVASRVKMNA